MTDRGRLEQRIARLEARDARLERALAEVTAWHKGAWQPSRDNSSPIAEIVREQAAAERVRLEQELAAEVTA